MSKGGKVEHEKTTQNGRQGFDPESKDQMFKIWGASDASGRAGPSPLATGAGDYNAGQMGAGQMGLGALSGDMQAYYKLQNPYEASVIRGANSQWDRNDTASLNAVDDRATRAGAFGGGRHGVASGVALANNNENRSAQINGLLANGHQNTMSQAALLAGLGQNASGMNANLGMGGVGSPEQWYAQQLQRGWNGPVGQTQNGVQSTTNGGSNWRFGLW
jgi:hypothetical protein